MILVHSSDYQHNSKLYNEYINKIQEIDLAIDEIELLKNENMNSSVLTDYNLDRIIYYSNQTSAFLTYIFAVLIGILAASSFIIIRENINNRILDEPTKLDQVPTK